MRFEFYHEGLEDVPKLSVDGVVPNAIHLSHWRGNKTPAELKADTSTEIALNLVASPDRAAMTRRIELVTNNHSDTDGALSVWTVLTGERALELRDRLVATAEAGDFSEYTNEDAVRASIVIQGSDQVSPGDGSGSPLARLLAGEGVDDEARAYELVLPEVERVITRTGDYEPLWRTAWDRIAAAVESFARGASAVEELAAARLSVITLAPEVFGPGGFDPARHTAPFTAISRYARGQLYLISTPASGGWAHRLDYPYYSWAETVVRPRVRRCDLTPFVARLDEMEASLAGRWRIDTSEMTSAVKFTEPGGTLGASALAPEAVAEVLRESLSEGAMIGGEPTLY